MVTSNKLEMMNIFQEGKIAHGTSFIGRKKLISQLMISWEESNGSGTYSVVGLNRMGKTSLVHEFRDRIKALDPSAICIIVSLGQNTLPNLIQLVMNKILRETDSLDEVSKKICEETCDISLETNKMLYENEIISNYLYLLKHFAKKNQHFMLVIDEFDSAKICWKDKASYFDCLRESVQQPGFFILVSRRPLVKIEEDSYGNSCFHNVFTELHVCSFDSDDMKDYYDVLFQKYEIELDESEREKIEEYTGFCPTILAGLGHRLATASIQHKAQPKVEDIFLDPDYQLNYQQHYDEFLKRMQEDGLWDELVRIIMDISSIRDDKHDNEDTFRQATINKLCCRGYLRKKKNDHYGDYIVFSDDFSAWARNKLYRKEADSIYRDIITAEVAIKKLIKAKMPQIWAEINPECDWENDFLENSSTVPECVKYFVSSDLKKYLRTAKRYDPSAGVADALSMRAKFSLVKEYWNNGIRDCFNNEEYSEWKDCFDLINDIRNPVFHGMITPDATTIQHYHLLADVNKQANRIITQLS